MKNNAILFLTISIFFSSISFSQQVQDTLYVASWNIENLFDTIDDTDKRDEDFLPDGKKKWSQEKIDIKIKHLAEVITSMNNGKGPSILGVSEVEHQHLLDTMLIRHFGSKNYKIAYAESPDKRGIDNGLIYDADLFSLNYFDTLRVNLKSGYPTRYIFHVNLIIKTGSEINLFVNHWPSRSGGEEKSRPNRAKAASVLKEKVDQLFKINKNSMIIALGDFNDEPNNESIITILDAEFFECNKDLTEGTLYNLSSKIFEEGDGTYLYRGDWNMLDQIIVSNGIISDNNFHYLCNSFELYKPSFMLTKSGKYKGAATPTYGGSRYLGGYSDHIPVGAKFIVNSTSANK